MTYFVFLFHDGSELVLEASECKHYSGHAALTVVTVIRNSSKLRLSKTTKYARLNIALNGQLGCMYPTDDINV